MPKMGLERAGERAGKGWEALLALTCPKSLSQPQQPPRNLFTCWPALLLPKGNSYTSLADPSRPYLSPSPQATAEALWLLPPLPGARSSSTLFYLSVAKLLLFGGGKEPDVP